MKEERLTNLVDCAQLSLIGVQFSFKGLMLLQLALQVTKIPV